MLSFKNINLVMVIDHENLRYKMVEPWALAYSA